MEEAKEMVLARLHLRAVLPLLEEIAKTDEVLAKETKGWNGVLQFQLAGGEPATALIFDNGKLSVYKGSYPGRRKVTLTFKDAKTLNEVFQGKSNKPPIPNVMALLHMKKLLKINNVMKRLEHYLKPETHMLKDKVFFEECVKLAVYVMAFGVKEVGEHDPELKANSPYLPDGTLALNVLGGPSANITIINGKFYPVKGMSRKPNALLEIKDIETAWDMIQGKLDVFAATGRGDIRLKGFIPLIDGINPLLDRLSFYMSD